MSLRDNRMRGALAKRNGQIFEVSVTSQAHIKKWEFIRIPDGCRQVSNTRMIRVKSPFDFVIAKDGKVLFFDAKSTKNGTFSYSMINQRQVLDLIAMERAQQASGYVVYFSKTDTVVFFKASLLKALRPREGLSEKDGLLLGNLEGIDFSRIFIITPEIPTQIIGNC